MQTYFNELADHVGQSLQKDEVFLARYHAEDSDFVRFNHGQVRQAGSVTQTSLELELVDGARHASVSLGLTGDRAADEQLLDRWIVRLRERLPHVPEDPFLLFATDAPSTEHVGANELRDASGDAIETIQRAAEGRDLVGVYASGLVASGFASSLGQRNWYQTHSHNFDWSFYHAADKAVKSAYAGFRWDEDAFRAKVERASDELAALARAPVTVPPGAYRVYLSPAAVYDIVGMLSWGGFGLKSHRTKQTPLLRLLEGEASFSDRLTLRENTREGIAPNFQGDGFLRPDEVVLIESGEYRSCLVSPRSAKEYGVPTNGAGAEESPESIDLGAGDLPIQDALATLGDGVYVGNVHYLNYSDRTACRTTGMTRFATFLVEGGELSAPLNVMRFDETLYRVLGENLVALTAEREMILDPGTYFERSTESGRVPGAIVEDFTFTL